MIIHDSRKWKVLCDICKDTALEIPQTRSCVGDEPRWAEIAELVDHNHHHVCNAHVFDNETGEWSGPYN